MQTTVKNIGIIDNRILLQVAILGLFEDDKMTAHEVAELTRQTVKDVWYGIRAEEADEA